MGKIADQVMAYLEVNKEAIKGKRAKRMTDCMNHFIELKSSLAETERGSMVLSEASSAKSSRRHSQQETDVGSTDSETEDDENARGPDRNGRDSDKNCEVSHHEIFGRAANLLRETFELDADGGVTFLSANSGLRHEHGAQLELHGDADGHQSNEAVLETGSKLSNLDLESLAHGISTSTTFDPLLNLFGKRPENPAHFLALSTQANPFARKDAQGGVEHLANNRIDQDVLRQLFKRYPTGKLWVFGEDGIMSSSEEEREYTKQYGSRKPLKRANSSTWQRGESRLWTEAFPGVRQLIFVPNWDAETSTFSSACFLWSCSETRVLTWYSDLSFLLSFCKTVMAELSRLNTSLADKQKGDFIGSISHELRSPLHGVLASAEFLVETATSTFQRTLIDTIDSCGRTLLDTINHVLDFSKINSFERNWQNIRRPRNRHKRKARSGAKISTKPLPVGAPPLLRIYDVTDVAAIAEEVVEGIAVGQIYAHATDITDVTSANRGHGANKGLRIGPHTTSGRGEGNDDHEPVEVIIDIDQGNWTFLTQPGALRRVVMNLFGNATKYTTSGFIKVQLQLEGPDSDENEGKTLILSVIDTGKGISPDFLNSKLFTPFAQENSLSPGTGLGLSIVRSIVTMLGGSIDLRSRVGEGTTVEVRMPLQRPLAPSADSDGTPPADSRRSSMESSSSQSIKNDSITQLKNVAAGCKVSIFGLSPDVKKASKRDSSNTLARYVKNWYGMEIVDPGTDDVPDIVLVEERDVSAVMNKDQKAGDEDLPALIILCSNATRQSQAHADVTAARIKGIVEFVSKPCGPYKLARALRFCFTRLRESQADGTGKLDSKQGHWLPEHGTPMTNGISVGGNDADGSALVAQESAAVVQDDCTSSASEVDPNAQIDTHLPETPQSSHSIASNSFPFPSTRQDGTPKPKLRPIHGSFSYPESVQQTPEEMHWSGNTQPHILLVDDNLINLNLLKAFMMKRKYSHLDYAEDGSIAVEIVKNADEPFDIIFMDVSMPVMNGFEATRAIRAWEKKTQVECPAMIIALTGLASGRDQGHGFSAGCGVYMTKPVSFKEVGKLLNNWEADKRQNIKNHDPLTQSINGSLACPAIASGKDDEARR